MTSVETQSQYIESCTSYKIENTECYMKWNEFCVASLNAAKEEIKKKSVLQYVSMDESKTEQHVLGIAQIADVISQQGWNVFAAVGFDPLVTVDVKTTVVKAAIMFAAALISPAAMAVVGIGSAVGIGGIVGIADAHTHQLYKHTELVIHVKNILKEIKPKFDQYQPGNTSVNRPKIQLLLNQASKAVVRIVVTDPTCICGQVLALNHLPELSQDQYSNYSFVICDLCNKSESIHDAKDIYYYHCPKKTNLHPYGFDVCIKCARTYVEKFKRYHAIIIETLPENVKYNDQDVNALTSLFESLNYHTIAVMKNNDANKANITKTLKRIATHNTNDAVVICYLGDCYMHGNHYEMKLQTGETFTHEELTRCTKSDGTCGIVTFLSKLESVDDEKENGNKSFYELIANVLENNIFSTSEGILRYFTVHVDVKIDPQQTENQTTLQSEEQIFKSNNEPHNPTDIPIDNITDIAACSNESHTTAENVTDDYVVDDYIDGTVSIQSEEQIFKSNNEPHNPTDIPIDNITDIAACSNESHTTAENVTDDYVADYIDGTVSIQSEEQIFSADIISAPLKSTETLLNLANQFKSNETFQTVLSTDPNLLVEYTTGDESNESSVSPSSHSGESKRNSDDENGNNASDDHQHNDNNH
eukprot:41680_1